MDFKQKLVCAIGLLSLCSALPAKAQSIPTCKAELDREITKIVNSNSFKRSRWGIAIRDLDTSQTLYELDSDKFFIPASTSKLLTTAAALDALGEDFRITTPIYATGELPNLRTLRIAGRGDPTLTTESLRIMVRQLKSLGIASVEELILDDNYFAPPFRNPTWEWTDSYYYYAPVVNSLILDENTARLTLFSTKVGQSVELQWSDDSANQWIVFNDAVTISANAEYTIEVDGVLSQPILNIRGELPQNKTQDVWDLAIPNPEEYFLATFESLLAEERIGVTQANIPTAIYIPEERIITQIYSPPLKELIGEINRESNNIYAEAILKILAKELNSGDVVAALENRLNVLGLDGDSYYLVDGSGLSRHNLITPKALADVLEIMSRHERSQSWFDSLAVAGVNGTLKNRLQQTELANNLRGKTGSLSGTITLAGYVELPKRNKLAVVILVNNFDDKNRIARQAMDEIILLLAENKNC